jgi:hypothetical protein
MIQAEEAHFSFIWGHIYIFIASNYGKIKNLNKVCKGREKDSLKWQIYTWFYDETSPGPT